MSKEGVSSKNIIKQIKESHSVYRLPASELAKLSREGVQDSVINYMERTRINDVRRNSMYYDPYYGYGGMFGYPWYGLWYSPGFGWPYSYGYWDYAPRIVIRSGNEFHGGEHSGRRH